MDEEGESVETEKREPSQPMSKVAFSTLLCQRYDMRRAENSDTLAPSHTDSVYHPLDRPFASMVALLESATTPEPCHSFRDSDAEEGNLAALVMSSSSLLSLMAVMVTFVVPNVSNQPSRPQVCQCSCICQYFILLMRPLLCSGWRLLQH